MKSIVICGAGPGLSSSVAKRYGQEGYEVVLVSRHQESLDKIAENLKSESITTYTVTGDLSKPGDMADLASRIRKVSGDPDVLYYAPTSPDMAFVPAAKLTVNTLQTTTNLLVSSFIALIGEFLGHMQEQHSGAILTAQGATALTGTPNMSGPGPAMAAQRNYLQALGFELENSGVFVGRVYISALIKGSAIHRRMEESGRKAPAAALVDPDTLAKKLWDMHQHGHPHEVNMPG